MKEINVRNRKLEGEEFFRQREEVLNWWPTGSDIDLEEAIQYRKELPEHKQWVNALSKAKGEGRILVGVFAGRATVEMTIDHLTVLDEAGIDFYFLLPDTYSRRRMYDKAESGLQESIKQGKSILNGFPIVNHGLSKARAVRENLNMPIIFVDSDSEHLQLITEMALASGFGHCSGDVECVLRTSKDYPLENKIIETQYQNRLAGYYTESGAPVMSVLHNALCGFDPPEMKIAIGTLHSLLVAEQGVKYIGQEISLGCHIIQDVAGLRVVKQLTEEYLKRYGYGDVDVSLQCFPFGGLWPRDRDRATATNALNIMIPILAGTDFFPIKSFAEAHGIPGKEAHLSAIRVAKQLLDVIGKQRLDEGEDLRMERQMMTLGARAIIDKTLELGDGDAAMGQIRAIEQGIIDVAFSPYIKVKGNVVPLRDMAGGVRYSDFGNIPFPPEVKEYHRQKIAAREEAREQKKRYEMMLSDIYYLARETM